MPDLAVEHSQARQSLEVLCLYRELYERLQAQGTRIVLRPPYGDQSVWDMGKFRLRHLYPVQTDPLPAWELIQQLADLPAGTAQEQEDSMRRFDRVSNLDSSVWLLEENSESRPRQLLLLGGDALVSCWNRLLSREQLSPAVLKLSHHGMRDGVSEEILQQLSPQWLLITNHQEEAGEYSEEWARLAAGIGAQVAVTGSEERTGWLVSQLPQLAKRVRR